jgi:phytoene dehydrogenase-like protein
MEVYEEGAMTAKTREADAIVVGGGLAGLAASAYLARAGRRVVLFEKAEAPGGRARTRALDGFHFNLGPHALYRAGRAAAVLRELGVAFDGGDPQVSGAYALHGGVLHTLPVGFVSLLTSGLLHPREKVEAARLLAGLRRIDTDALQGTALAEWLRENVHGPAVRDLLGAFVRVSTYADDSERISAGAGLAQFRMAGQGVIYLHGGWQTLVEGLRRVGEQSGVRVVTGSPVASILRDPVVRGVRLEDGTTVTAPAVLIAASPSAAAALVAEGGAPAGGDWPARSIAVRAACLDVALERLPRPAARVALGMDEPLYLSVHSAVARLAPEGGALIHVARYGGLRAESAAVVEARLMSFLESVQPGWRRFVVRQRFLPDLVVTNALVAAAAGGLPGRPRPEVPEAPGLYLAGDWVGSEGMLADASLASARSAARAILAGGRESAAA